MASLVTFISFLEKSSILANILIFSLDFRYKFPDLLCDSLIFPDRWTWGHPEFLHNSQLEQILNVLG